MLRILSAFVDIMPAEAWTAQEDEVVDISTVEEEVAAAQISLESPGDDAVVIAHDESIVSNIEQPESEAVEETTREIIGQDDTTAEDLVSSVDIMPEASTAQEDEVFIEAMTAPASDNVDESDAIAVDDPTAEITVHEEDTAEITFHEEDVSAGTSVEDIIAKIESSSEETIAAPKDCIIRNTRLSEMDAVPDSSCDVVSLEFNEQILAEDCVIGVVAGHSPDVELPPVDAPAITILLAIFKSRKDAASQAAHSSDLKGASSSQRQDASGICKIVVPGSTGCSTKMPRTPFSPVLSDK